MIRITFTKSAAQAKTYFEHELSDYYSEDNKNVGIWGGKGSEMLGLNGKIAGPDFYRLCDNLHPSEEKSLTPNTLSNRIVFSDWMFSAPKSLSILYGITKNERILGAFHGAVKETLADMEAESMQVRVRSAGRQEDRHTGNIVYGLFTHFSARPENGRSDPQLHVHATVFNASYDHQESKWKAAQFHGVKMDSPYHQAAFLNRLACNMKDLGFGIDAKSKGQFEIAGIPKDLIQKFSQRTAAIEKKAKELGITGDKAKSELGAKTRKAKLKNETLSVLQAEWFGRLSSEDKKALNELDKFSHHKNDTDIHKSFDYAVGHSFERQSVMNEKRFWENVLKHGVGALSVEEVKKYKHESLLYAQTEKGRAVSTKEVLLEEQNMLDLAKKGKNTCLPLNEKPDLKNSKLNAQQKNAVEHLLESTNRHLVLSGGAGVGKSTLLSEVAKGIRENGKEVLALAPSSGAREVLEKDGFAAQTLQKFLLDKDLQEKQKGQAVLLDEAGLVGTRPMKQLFELAGKHDFRLILSGDQYQHHSVEHGDAFRLLIQQGILPSARVQQVVRQKGDYAQAMEHLAANRLDAGFEMLDKMGWVEEVKPKKILSAIADEYVQQTQQPDKSVLIVAPTHKEGHEITEQIRSKLKESGRLEAETAKTFTNAYALNLTEEEKKQPRSYESGQELIFHKAEKGFHRGKAYKIEGPAEALTLRTEKGKAEPLPLHHSASFGVFQPRSTEICVNDKIKIQANATTLHGHRIINGAEYTVKGFDKGGNIKLNNGWSLGKDFRLWNLGYVHTGQSVQGKTVDSVLVLQDTKGQGSINKEGFYVAASRARKQAKIFTTDKNELKEMAARSSSRLSATELAFRAEKQQQRIRNRTKFMQFVQRVKASLRGLGNLGAAPPRSQERSPQLGYLQSALKQTVQKPQRVFSMKDRRIMGHEPAYISRD